jgi:4-hydroxyphenylpyruvate dioxygenase
MRHSIATVSLSGTLREKLTAIAAARFDGIELFEPDFTHSASSAAEVRAMASDLGLSIDLFQPLRDFEGMPEAAFRRSLDRAERKFDLMQQLGTPMILVCSNTSPLALAEPERAAAQLRELAERAARRNLRVGFEALSWGRHVNRFRQAWSIVEQADHPHLGLILDSFHTLALCDDPAGIADLPGDKIFFLQLADAPQLSMDVIQWARHHRCFPGQGQFDLVRYTELVLKAGYSGPLSLEIFNDVFRETPNRRTATDARRSLLHLESQVRHRLAQIKPERNGGSIGVRSDLLALEPAPAVGGVAFVEFAVDSEGGARLGALLERFGFTSVGVHRSKAVTLYRQGDIHLIVNTQPDSHARERFSDVGPSICAIGLRTSDPDAIVARAVALQSVRYDSPRGPGEARLPAIVAPGGSVVHFLPEADPDPLMVDFGVASHASDVTGRVGLNRIDHLGLGLAVDQADTWVLFGRSILGLEPSDALELADPFGLVRNRGLATPDRALRFVLNVSASLKTGTARAVSAQRGAAVLHVGFATDDIMASVDALRAAGVSFVPISGNYHDDLLTRFDLTPEFVQQLRERGILFDRTADGEFLHAYCDAFEGRFFFEIVQRVGRYDGYGALNAPARMAALAERSLRTGPDGQR